MKACNHPSRQVSELCLNLKMKMKVLLLGAVTSHQVKPTLLRRGCLEGRGYLSDRGACVQPAVLKWGSQSECVLLPVMEGLKKIKKR